MLSRLANKSQNLYIILVLMTPKNNPTKDIAEMRMAALNICGSRSISRFLIYFSILALPD